VIDQKIKYSNFPTRRHHPRLLAISIVSTLLRLNENRNHTSIKRGFLWHSRVGRLAFSTFLKAGISKNVRWAQSLKVQPKQSNRSFLSCMDDVYPLVDLLYRTERRSDHKRDIRKMTSDAENKSANVERLLLHPAPSKRRIQLTHLKIIPKTGATQPKGRDSGEQESEE
jgi:hypothetical protein